jgi:hypothetical protein
MSLIPNGLAKSAAAAADFYDHPIEQSLRFNANDNPQLLQTFASAGNQKTWTMSMWIKNTGINDSEKIIWGCQTNTYTTEWMRIMYYGANDGISWESVTYPDETLRIYLRPTQVFRDPSAWYHIVFKWDSTQATASDRAAIYINGEKVTDFRSGAEIYPSQNYNGFINNGSYPHSIGGVHGYGMVKSMNVAEVNFIDGTALDADSFGETKSGVWIPKAYSGSYGTNGFYLPFNHDYSVEGFSAVTWKGSQSTEYIGGVGFQPDLVIMKTRSSAYDHWTFDSVRGVGNLLATNTTAAEASFPTILSSFDNDGFTTNGYGLDAQFVAWCWDAGTGSSVSNTDGSITSTVKASTDYGFSVVSYTGNETAGDTVGHGLSSAPEMMIIKRRNAIENWQIYHSGISADPETDYLEFTTAAAADNANRWNDTAPTSSVFTLGTHAGLNHSGSTYIAYCFHSVSGYSKIGSYTGAGANTSVTTGFKPAFVLLKNVDDARDWFILDNTRDPGAADGNDYILRPNTSGSESTIFDVIQFDDTGFTLTGSYNATNASGQTFIYMAFADKREAAFWLDQSGNNNDFTNNNLTESDISLDSPTNNFATLNPLSNFQGATISEGNLKAVGSASDKRYSSTLGMNSGKWYWEVDISTVGNRNGVGVFSEDNTTVTTLPSDYAYLQVGNSADFTSGTDNYAQPSWSAGDILTIAFDADNGKVFYGKNSAPTVSGSGDHYGLSTSVTYLAGCRETGATVGTNIYNFGQDSSFAGNKTAQGNTDDNGYGDFYYAPPTGYLALCTANLEVPDAMNPALDNSPQDYFNTVLYSGNSSTQSITGVGFQPDFVWTKERSIAREPNLYDVLRGATKFLATSDTGAEATLVNSLTSFDSDGFSLGSDAATNYTGRTYVAWNWKANGSGVSNTDGSITSTVSANTDAGFSIVSYTGTGANATVGHGLNSAPEMIIVKDRDTAYNWVVYSESIPNTQYLLLNSTQAVDTFPMWNNTSPTSSVFNLGYFGWVNNSGDDHIAYCFHSVEGFSKFGSYTGNGSSDGPFVYTGFRPAFVMVKSASSSGYDWWITDAERNTYNVINYGLRANSTAVEVSDVGMNYMSNGFKYFNDIGAPNINGVTYIYMAFAENPFKYANAR